MKKVLLLCLSSLIFVVPALAKNEDRPAPKVDVCHNSEDTLGYHLINISENALQAHLDHGDVVPGGAVPGVPGHYFNAECESVIDLPTVPSITSPASGTTLTTAALTAIDWTASTGSCSPITYQYEAFNDSAYIALIYSSSWLNTNMIPTPGTPEGTYYLRVRAKDNCGNFSDWSNGSSNTYFLTVQNPILVDSAPLQYGSFGWGGWSCPTDKKIQSATVTGITVLQSADWKSGATLGSATYPNTPFGYTYTPPEEGFIAQADVAGGTAVIHLVCY